MPLISERGSISIRSRSRWGRAIPTVRNCPWASALESLSMEKVYLAAFMASTLSFLLLHERRERQVPSQCSLVAVWTFALPGILVFAQWRQITCAPPCPTTQDTSRTILGSQAGFPFTSVRNRKAVYLLTSGRGVGVLPRSFSDPPRVSGERGSSGSWSRIPTSSSKLDRAFGPQL